MPVARILLGSVAEGTSTADTMRVQFDRGSLLGHPSSSFMILAAKFAHEVPLAMMLGYLVMKYCYQIDETLNELRFIGCAFEALMRVKVSGMRFDEFIRSLRQ